MAPRSNAEKLDIRAGSRLWLIGDTVEEASLLDPLPDDVEIFTPDDEIDETPEPSWHDDTWGSILESEPVEPVRPTNIDVAVIMASHPQEFHRELDDKLVRMGSMKAVWIVHVPMTLPLEIIETGLADYGWHVTDSVELNETWTARRVKQ